MAAILQRFCQNRGTKPDIQFFPLSENWLNQTWLCVIKVGGVAFEANAHGKSKKLAQDGAAQEFIHHLQVAGLIDNDGVPVGPPSKRMRAQLGLCGGLNIGRDMATTVNSAGELAIVPFQQP